MLFRSNEVARIVSLVRQLSPLPAWPRVSEKSVIDAMRSDKKSRAGTLRFVLSPRIGKAATYDKISLRAVERVLRFAPHFFCDDRCDEAPAHITRAAHA